MSLTAVWSVRLANERNVKSRGPVLADGVVYQLFHYDKRDFFESRLMALALATGEELWHATVDHVANRPAIGADGTVFLSSFDGAVAAYDPNGDQIWRCDAIDSNIGPPTLAGSDHLVLAEIHGRARRTWCLNARTGAVLWTFDNGGHSYTLAATQDVVVHATVVSGANFGESTVRLFALSARDGSVRWSASHTEYMFVPAIIDDTVIVGARGAVLAYDLASGKERARLALPEGTAAMHLLALPENSMAVAGDATTLRHLELRRQKAFLSQQYEADGALGKPPFQPGCRRAGRTRHLDFHSDGERTAGDVRCAAGSQDRRAGSAHRPSPVRWHCAVR